MEHFCYKKAISETVSPSSEHMSAAQGYLDRLAKPPGSLGALETVAAKLCGIQRTEKPDIKKRCVIVCAADNGVVAQGVASAPQAVTHAQTINIAKGITGVGVLAKQFGAELLVADLGVIGDIDHPNVLNRKLRNGTGDISVEVAMTRQEAENAINIGIELCHMAHNKGYSLVGVGEMGIGNTTTSSAVLAAVTSLPHGRLSEVVGRGAGLDDTAYDKKVDTVKRALALHAPKSDDIVGVLSTVGGLDLACMTGVYIGCAKLGIPVVVDGFISAVAALCATKLSPLVSQYLFTSHMSHERGYAFAVEALGVSPHLMLGMRLGEGSGCPLMFAVMDGALAVYYNMVTFDGGNINSDYLDDIKSIGEGAF